jgi:hypothetical protein
MGTDNIDSFREYREKMNEKLLALDSKAIIRIFNLNTLTPILKQMVPWQPRIKRCVDELSIKPSVGDRVNRLPGIIV